MQRKDVEKIIEGLMGTPNTIGVWVRKRALEDSVYSAYNQGRRDVLIELLAQKASPTARSLSIAKIEAELEDLKSE